MIAGSLVYSNGMGGETLQTLSSKLCGVSPGLDWAFTIAIFTKSRISQSGIYSWNISFLLSINLVGGMPPLAILGCLNQISNKISVTTFRTSNVLRQHRAYPSSGPHSSLCVVFGITKVCIFALPKYLIHIV